MGQKISYVISFLLYYLIVLPISWLPMSILHMISDVLYLLLIYLIPYREKLIRKNIYHSFPNATHKERVEIKRKFYRHFADLIVEGIKNLSISENELLRRFKISNPDLLKQLYKKNKNVLLVGGHYNNWEWLISSQNFLFRNQAVGIGMPISNVFFNQKINERRARFGMKILHPNFIHEFYESPQPKPYATLILSDQSPGNSEKSFWMNFLNQPTAVLFGCELIAHQYDQAVVYFTISKPKRGHYLMHLELITESPKTLKWGEITTQHTHLLERDIIKKPEFWLWSHNRWKRKIPKDIELLRTTQKENFNRKFNSINSQNPT